jgi:hypothetical protein
MGWNRQPAGKATNRNKDKAMASIKKSSKIKVFSRTRRVFLLDLLDLESAILDVLKVQGSFLLFSRRHHQQLYLPVLSVFFSFPSSFTFLCKFACFFVSFRILCSAILLCSLHVLFPRISTRLSYISTLLSMFLRTNSLQRVLNYLKRVRLSRGRMIWLFAHPQVPTPPLSRQYTMFGQRHKGRLRMRDNLLMGWGGARPGNVEKAWSSVNPSVLSGITKTNQGRP